MAEYDAGRFTPLMVGGKRDKARRYVDSTSGEVVSRRKAENLSLKQAGREPVAPSGIAHRVLRLRRRYKVLDQYPSYLRHGPFYSLDEVKDYKRLPGETEVLLVGYGSFKKNQAGMKSPQTGKGYRTLSSWIEVEELQKAIDGIKNGTPTGDQPTRIYGNMQEFEQDIPSRFYMMEKEQ